MNIHQASNGSDAATKLNELGTLLRDEDNRNDPNVVQAIPYVLEHATDEPMEVLRVLVNFTADHDHNRRWLLGDDAAQFWPVANGFLRGADRAVADRTVVLVSQFIHAEPPVLEEFAAGLAARGVPESVAQYYRACLADGDVDLMALAAEFMAETSGYSWADVAQLVRGAELAVHDDEALLVHSQALLALTGREDGSGEGFVVPVYNLFKHVLPDLPNVAHIKRRLFAACGNVTSLPRYDNFGAAKENVARILGDEDSYVKAAAAISLGNCVADEASQQRLLDTIAEVAPLDAVVAALLHTAFGDVVQYQYFHLFNNAMTPRVAQALLLDANVPRLVHSTRVIVDNYKYYKEIGAVYLKFLRKLAKQHAGDVTAHEAIWTQLQRIDGSDALDVELLLLQTAAAQHKSFSQPFEQHLLGRLFDTSLTIDANLLLHKLTTIAVLVQNTTGVPGWADPLSDFLAELSRSLASAPETTGAAAAQAGAVKNNSKFVAASVLAMTEKSPPAPACQAKLDTACRAVLRLE